MEPRIFVLIGIVASALMITSYYDYAVKKDWPIRSFFLPDKGKAFKLFVYIVGIYFCIAGTVDFGWHYLLIIPIAGFILAVILTQIMQRHSQVLSVILFVVLVLTNIIMQVEVVSA